MASEQANGVAPRALPKKRNPLLGHDKLPAHEDLIKKRRLGRTKLSVPPGLVGRDNSTKPENLGDFDYAHLRAPLPRNLQGSEIFVPQPHQSSPEFYFLMRRSKDGFISATGMFKAAFPWAKHLEETAERDYIKTLPSVQAEEVAGNLWISEHHAIELAEEYGIAPWIEALLDEEPIQPTPDAPSKASISPPPTFKFTANDRTHLPPSSGTARASTPKSRGRPRAGSPVKMASPQKSSKKRMTKKEKEAEGAVARQASEALQSALDDAASAAAAESSVEGDKAKVTVESIVEVEGDKETTTTNVTVEAPSKDLEVPENPEQMIAKAKEMVEEAKKVDAESSSGPSKRKAGELDDSDESADNELQPAKRARRLQEQLKTERVRNRAIVGVAATLAIGAIIPFVLPG